MRRLVSAVGLVATAALSVSLLGAPAQGASTVGSTAVLPQVSQPGTKVASAGSAKAVVQARITAKGVKKKGRTVTFYRKASGGSWKKLGTAKQDSRGHAVLRKSTTAGWQVRAKSSGSKKYTTVATVPRWTSVFRDDFTGKKLDTSKWAQRDDTSESRSCANVSAANATVGGGVAKIVSKRSKTSWQKGCKTYSKNKKKYTYSNAQITTMGKVASFKPTGVAAARIKFSAKPGAHASFWLQEPWRASNRVEIDVVEGFGSKSKAPITQFIHYGNSSSKVSYSNIKRGRSGDWWKRYHVFSVEWTPSQYIFRIDGIETGRTAKGKTSRPHDIILSNLTSNWELKANDGTTNTMQVDWVRYWNKG